MVTKCWIGGSPQPFPSALYGHQCSTANCPASLVKRPEQWIEQKEADPWDEAQQLLPVRQVGLGRHIQEWKVPPRSVCLSYVNDQRNGQGFETN